MIVFLALSGPRVGEIMKLKEGDVNPYKLLSEFARENWNWAIGFDYATPSELFRWSRVDMAARIMKALLHGRPVLFHGITYTASDKRKADEVILHCLDRVLVSSECYAYVASDDEDGVLIGEGPFKELHRWN